MAKRVLSASYSENSPNEKRSRQEKSKFWTLTSEDEYKGSGIAYTVKTDEVNPAQNRTSLSETSPSVPTTAEFSKVVNPAKNVLPVQKSLLHDIFNTILEQWTTEDYESTKYSYYCTNPTGFKPLFEDFLGQQIRRSENKGILAHVQNLKSVRDNLELYLPDIFSRFLSCAGISNNQKVLSCLDDALSYRNHLKSIKKAGQTCRKRAKWIGVEETPPLQLANFVKKRLVETVEQVQIGLQSGFLIETPANFISLDDQVNRICAPKPNDKTTWSIILWKKQSPDDDDPRPEKIIGGCIYNFEKLSSKFASENEYVGAHYHSTQSLATMKPSVDRDRITSDGKMAKSSGTQAVYGKAYDVEMVLDMLPEGNDIFDNQNVRLELKNIGTFVEARDHELLLGFLPEFANKRFSVAKENHLLNPLGYPHVSNFATFGYSASSHIDADDSPTMGWVLKRPANLDRNSNNFVWVSYRTLVEMATDMFWFWDAAKDFHGTTVSTGALSNPQSKVTPAFMKNNPDSGQWTSASVLPKTVTQAHSLRKKGTE